MIPVLNEPIVRRYGVTELDTYPGVQLSMVRKKLNVVADRISESWAWSPMEPSEKG